MSNILINSVFAAAKGVTENFNATLKNIGKESAQLNQDVKTIDSLLSTIKKNLTDPEKTHFDMKSERKKIEQIIEKYNLSIKIKPPTHDLNEIKDQIEEIRANPNKTEEDYLKGLALMYFAYQAKEAELKKAE